MSPTPKKRRKKKAQKKSFAPNFGAFFSSFKENPARFSFCAKVSFTLLCLGAFYGIYLDGKIRHKMDGQIWQLPAEVYARIPEISLNSQPSRTEILALLAQNGYRQTTMLANPADYKIQGNEILLLRRAFPFPGQPQGQHLFRLFFNNNQISQIDDLTQNQHVTHFPLAPKLIAMLQSENEDRLAHNLTRFPRLLIDTLLATEDRHFFQHDGISPLGILRALWANFRAGHKVQGGSTITQQLVKNLFLTNERSFVRKFNEAFMALLLDYRYDKNQILETYLNEVYLGQMGDHQIHGFALASLFYFDRPINEISLDKIALLIGMVKGPSLYNPWRNPSLALQRRNVVLHIMLENKIIDENLYQMLRRRPLGVQEKGQVAQKYPAFMQALRRELRDHLGASKISMLSGTRIFTTLDVEMQQAVEKSVQQSLQQLQKQRRLPLQSAMMIVDYKTGGIRALVSDANPNFAGFNRALDAKRQIGSLAKPPVYLTALSEPSQFALNTLLNNQPLSIAQKGQKAWQPRNYNRLYSEPVLLIDALTQSLNIPTVNLGLKVGLKKIIATQKAMGWDNVDMPNVPSMLLGSYSISPFDVTRLYQTLANQGAKVRLSALNQITDLNGQVLYQDTRNAQQVVPQQSSFITLFAMQNVVKNGTARRLQKNFASLNLAGKTGTTNQSRDTWFVGIDGQNIATVWVGLDNNGKTGLTGSTGALRVYENYLSHYKPAPLKLRQPSEIDWAGINFQGAWQCDLPYKLPFWQTAQSLNCKQEQKARSSSLWDWFK